MKTIKAILLVGLLSPILGCGPHHAGAPLRASGTNAPAAAPHPGPARHFTIPGDQTLSIRAGRASIQDAQGKVLAENPRLIRIPDEHGECPSRGLIGVTTGEDGFTVHQQNCSGWHLIEETLKFVLASDGGYVLWKVVLRYIDRRAPESEDTVKVLRSENIGSIRFEDVEPDRLYKYPGTPSR